MSDNQPNTPFQLDIVKISQELRVRAEIYQRLVISFSKSLVVKLDEFGTAMDQNDVMKMRAIMHELKGTSGNLRVGPVSEAVQTLHTAVKSGDPQEKLKEYFAVLKTRANEFAQFASKLAPISN